KITEGTNLPAECHVQGRTEMMVSEYCVGGSFVASLQGVRRKVQGAGNVPCFDNSILDGLHEGNCQFRCREKLFLRDRQEAEFPVVGDQYCRMHVLNSVELSLAANIHEVLEAGVTSLRMDGRYYSVEELRNLIKMYRDILDGKKSLEENLPHTTRGHYFRGVE
ncbi:MAG: U32 family peptidase, partial [Acidaminococcaceae bacterium]|nr:U32 family peptidase [Acidaminococcaceae bacterium]